MALKVLLADDHEGFRKTVLEYLKTQGGIEIVGEASNGIDPTSAVGGNFLGKEMERSERLNHFIGSLIQKVV